MSLRDEPELVGVSNHVDGTGPCCLHTLLYFAHYLETHGSRGELKIMKRDDEYITYDLLAANLTAVEYKYVRIAVWFADTTRSPS